MRYQIAIDESAYAYPCRDGQSVLLAMVASGQRVLQVGCRSGGCGVCRVEVMSGEFDTGTMSAAHIAEADRAGGIVLACQLYPRSNLRLRVLGPENPRRDDSFAALLKGSEHGNA